jgi:hypothetical protein
MKAPEGGLAHLSPTDFFVFHKRLKGPQPQQRRVTIDFDLLKLCLTSGDTEEEGL